MATLHKTTMSPGKLELLADWLPAQPWWASDSAGELTRAGGFRLDDPAGEVGLEFMAVRSADVTYLVPMSYRGHADGPADALIGTSEHGVLGTRWIYDGVHDPVLVAQLVALISGQAEPQAQTVSDTADPTVVARAATDAPLDVTGFTVRDGRTLVVDVRGGGQLTIGLRRVLKADEDRPGADGGVTGTWQFPSGAQARGVFATATYRHGALAAELRQ